jgi:hypothetical protein
MKKIIGLLTLLIVLIAVLVTLLTIFHIDIFKTIPGQQPQEQKIATTTAPIAQVPAIDPHDGTYMLEGQPITLKDGHYEAPAAPGSAQIISVEYFGNDALGDLNGDGIPDRVFLITMDSGGTGTFFYVVAAVSSSTAPGGVIGSEAYSIGDRIAPQTTAIDNQGVIIVNYADRAPGEPFTAQPSVGKTLRLKLNTSTMRFDTK